MTDTIKAAHPDALAKLAEIPAAGSEEALSNETRRIARAHGCDRGFFTVCWGEHERGEVCRCKEEARANLTTEGTCHG